MVVEYTRQLVTYLMMTWRLSACPEAAGVCSRHWSVTGYQVC